MTSKEYLEQIKLINLKIRIINEEVQEIRSMLGAKGINYEYTPGGVISSTKDKMAQLIYKLIDKQNELLEEYVNLSQTKAEVKSTVYKMDDTKLVELIYKRYFQLKKWKTIGSELGYSQDYLKHLHMKALGEIDQIRKQNTKDHYNNTRV